VCSSDLVLIYDPGSRGGDPECAFEFTWNPVRIMMVKPHGASVIIRKIGHDIAMFDHSMMALNLTGFNP
jgi:hypothetical protein